MKPKHTKSLIDTAFWVSVPLTLMQCWAAIDTNSLEALGLAFIFGGAGLLFMYFAEET